MRVVRNLLAFLFFLAATAVVGLVLALYLAASGRNVPMLRSVVGALGRTIAGQQTTEMSLAVRLQPDLGRLGGTARLTVRAVGGERQRFYFLLNEGLRPTAAWREDGPGARTALPLLRLWMVTIVDLPEPLAADAEARIALDYAGEPRRAGIGMGAIVMQPNDVVIAPADFWYPADLQGFFLADVEVLLPSHLTLVHNGRPVSHTIEGSSARVRFSTERPVPALALVAGRYSEHAADRNGVRSRVLLPDDVRIDPARLLEAVGASQQTFTRAYGPSGFAQTTLFVQRALMRAFNDGSGLIGVSPRYFADGDHGFGLIAHEVAHNWWGGTVAEQWLLPGTGGEWLVEGFAEFSGWRALREHRGEHAWMRARARDFFDPDQAGALQDMSVIDNGLDPVARATIYNKGAWVTYMLQQELGEEGFDTAARQFLDQFRHRAATANDLETVFAASSQQDLASFFTTWVRGKEAIDLALDVQDGGAAVRNHRLAPAPPQLALWRFPPNSEPEKQTTTLGASTPIGNAERVVLDPLAAVADMFRSNNVLPRHDNPRFVATSARGDLMTVRGEPYAWEPATIDVAPRGGGAVRSWVIDRGLMSEPTWSADGTRVLAVESPRGGQPTLLALNVADGSRQTVGHDTVASGATDGTIVVRGDRLLRIAGRDSTLLAEHPGARIWAPLAAPHDGGVAYVVGWQTASMDLRYLPADGSDSRVLFTWPAGPLRWRWSPDGSRLFVALAGDWDWQLWEIAVDGSAPRLMVREAAIIADLAVADDGNRIAIVAQADIDDPMDRMEVFIADRRSTQVQRFNLGGRTAYSAAWRDEDNLAVVVADTSYPSLPLDKQLRTLRLSDGSLEPF